MAFNQGQLERTKAIGMYRFIEWNTNYGVLIKTFDKDLNDFNAISFEAGTFDKEYDQRVDNYRQFFVSREAAVKLMLNLNFTLIKIAKIFKQIDGKQIAWENLQ